MKPFAPVYPHGKLEQIAADIYLVRGSIALNPVVRITRNMVVVHHAGELTLVNPVRVDEPGLAELDALGAVKHVLRLGAFHGIDDPFYVARYRARFWAQAGGSHYTEPAIDHALRTDGDLPFPMARFVAFEHTRQPEGVILIEQGSGLLLTTDAIQHYGDYSYNNWAARLVMPFIGFSKTTLVGPIWLKLMTSPGDSLRDELSKLLTLHFDSLVAAHGTFLAHGAHAAVARAIDKAFS